MSDKDIKAVLLHLFIKCIVVIGIAILSVYYVSNQDVILKLFVCVICSLFIFWLFSNQTGYFWKTKPLIEDKIVTFIIFIVFGIIYYSSWWNFTNILGLDLKNPLMIGFFIMIFIVNIVILIPRYTKLNIIKSIGWAISLSVFGIIAFSYSILETLNECSESNTFVGTDDPFYIVFSIYAIWLILIGLLFFVDIIDWGNTKKKILGLCILIGFGLLKYIWKRCTDAQVNGQYVVTNEAKWINMSAYISMLVAYFNLFIGHYIGSFYFGILGYSIVDQCAAKDDLRKQAFAVLLIIILPFIYFISIIKSHYK